MSPEQAMGAVDVDGRADVYALGSVLYEMIAGEPPFTGPTPRAIMTRSMTEVPRSLTTTRDGLIPEVDRVALKALAKSPADRFPTAEALASALDQSLDQVRSGARPVIVPTTGPAPMQVLLLFLLASAAVLVMAFALVRQVGLPQWMFWVAVILMLAGLPIMMLTAKAERLKAQGKNEGGLMGFLNWRRG
jgi:serine/threonine-protein kinase